MLFAAGKGVGLLFWGTAEPLIHYDLIASYEDSRSAANMALFVTNFHWGLHAWAIYALTGLVIAYFGFRRGCPSIMGALGLSGIERDAPRPGRKKEISARKVNQVIRLTTQEKPKNVTHWSRRLMAERVNISDSSVGRIWRAHGLKPHRVTRFKLSNDKQFQYKLEDVVGLYLAPPDNAIVFSCDEKSQIQALDRTQPGLPIKAGREATMAHDYKRHGTTTPFAALNVLTGEVLGQCAKRHRYTERLKFLRFLNKNTPPDKEIHISCDNYATQSIRLCTRCRPQHIDDQRRRARQIERNPASIHPCVPKVMRF